MFHLAEEEGPESDDEEEEDDNDVRLPLSMLDSEKLSTKILYAHLHVTQHTREYIYKNHLYYQKTDQKNKNEKWMKNEGERKHNQKKNT